MLKRIVSLTLILSLVVSIGISVLAINFEANQESSSCPGWDWWRTCKLIRARMNRLGLGGGGNELFVD